jgi:hypothetical protein
MKMIILKIFLYPKPDTKPSKVTVPGTIDKN